MILHEWVTKLGLRHQGVLLAAVRGPDGLPKEDAAKILHRYLRGVLLKSHNGDPFKASSFIVPMIPEKFIAACDAFLSSTDHYNLHHFMHLLFAAEIIGYHAPSEYHPVLWTSLYERAVRSLHLYPETRADLDRRLNADEAAFAKQSEI